MKYIISNLLPKKWQDKDFTESTFESMDGVITEKVSDWTGTVKENGQEVEGEVVKNEKGYYRFMPPKAVAGASFKAQQIEKAVERKEKSISSFQGNKENGIKIASTMRDAVLCAIAEFKERPDEKLEDLITKWRHWLWSYWDVDIKDYEDALE